MRVHLQRVAIGFFLYIDGKALLDGITGHPVVFSKEEGHGFLFGGQDNGIFRAIVTLSSPEAPTTS